MCIPKGIYGANMGIIKKAIFGVVGIILAAALLLTAFIYASSYQSLNALLHQIDAADRMVVTNLPEDNPTKADILFQSTDRKDFEALKASISIKQGSFGMITRCMCEGSPAIQLYQGNRKIETITNHHGRLLRCSLWQSDVVIADTEQWLKWFDNRNIGSARQEVEQLRKSALADQLAKEKWLAALPASMKSIWSNDLGSIPTPNLDPFRKALAKEFPQTQSRICALLKLYGSGQGPWSGFPAYEDVVEKLLLDYDTATLLDAIQSASLSPEETEGSARLLGGWSFNRERPNDNQKIPKELKHRLWNHTKNTTDKDKLARAQTAFKSQE